MRVAAAATSLVRAGPTWDLALGVALAAGAVAESLATGGDQAPLRAGLAGLTVLMLVFRRRHPLVSTSLIAVGLATESVVAESPDEITVLFAVIISAFSVAAWSSRRDALVGLGFLSVSIALSISRDPSDSVGNIPPTLLLFICLPAGLGFAFHRRGQEVAALELRTDALEQEAAAALDMERSRIARELHDVVSHAVTLIAVQSEAGRAVLDRDPAAAGRSLDAIGVASRDALAELHSMLTLLRAEDRADSVTGGLARLPALLEGARSAGMSVELTESGERQALSPEVDHCAYRVVQEGLTNALRHSREPQVRVSIGRRRDSVSIGVASSGTPHQSAYGGSGLGLVQLKERVLSLGGAIDTGPSGPNSFTIKVSLPGAIG